jgi:hypothetical protein
VAPAAAGGGASLTSRPSGLLKAMGGMSRAAKRRLRNAWRAPAAREHGSDHYAVGRQAQAGGWADVVVGSVTLRRPCSPSFMFVMLQVGEGISRCPCCHALRPAKEYNCMIGQQAVASPCC